ncbi:conserved hypothetical protein [Vibrio owensii]|uniref:ATP-grasp fold amidoligase family protein n=1 Tax=Vibrio owensii TaxID=696485 RepID=UPI002895EFD0|nr:conserved hypothetical protein [Vibrio owensii]
MLYIRRMVSKMPFLHLLISRVRRLVRSYKLLTVNEGNAKTFNEKLLLRIKKTSDEKIARKMSDYADKYLAKAYVSELVGKEFVIPLIAVCDELSKDTWDLLPEKFVIKTNFGTGALHYHIVTNKEDESFVDVKRKFDLALKDDWFVNTSEFAYKYIERKIIIENYISGSSGNISPDDYKLHMFAKEDGDFEVIIQTDTSRFEGLKRNFFDSDFNLLNIHYTGSVNYDLNIPKERVNEMIALSKTLVANLTYARVDWYFVDGRIYFGEITHTHVAGNAIFTPRSANKFLGEKIKFNSIFRT